MSLYQFIWGDFCSWHVENIKPTYGQPLDRKTYKETIGIFERMMSALHPFMPFVTEEIWHQLRNRREGNDCILSDYPRPGRVDKALVERMERAKDIISKIRDTRSSNGVSPKEELKLFIEKSESSEALFALEGVRDMLVKLGNLSTVEFTDSEPPSTVNFLSGRDKFYLEVNIEIDVEAEKENIESELKRLRGFIGGIEKKLSNERFVNNAPTAVVDKERKKLADGTEKIRLLEESLAKLN